MFYKMYYFSESSLNFLFVGLVMSRLFSVKNNWNKHMYIILSTLFFTVIYYGPYFLGLMQIPIDYNYAFMISIGCSIFWSAVCLKGIVFSKFSYIIFYYSFLRCMKFIFAPFYQYRGVIDERIYVIVDFAMVVATYYLLFRITLIFKKYPIMGSEGEIQYRSRWILACPVCVFLILLILTPSVKLRQNTIESFIAILLLVILFVSYFMFAKLIYDYEKSIRLDQALMETRAQVARFRYSIILEEQIKKDRHEIKNLYFYLLAMLKEKKYEKMEKYLEDNLAEIDLPAGTINTGNVMIDYILNTKIAEAQRKNIKTMVDVLLPANLDMDENVICTILLNLFDNAIEASVRERDSDLQVKMKCVQNYVQFRISNKANSDLIKDNPLFLTTKPDKKNHGYGIKIINEAVEKVNGIIDYKMKDGYFTVTVMLPLLES